MSKPLVTQLTITKIRFGVFLGGLGIVKIFNHGNFSLHSIIAMCTAGVTPQPMRV